MENSNDNEETNKKPRDFEELKTFFDCDAKIKNLLLACAPTEADNYSPETRMKYFDELEKYVKDLEGLFYKAVEGIIGDGIHEEIKNKFQKVKDSLLISDYSSGICQKIYNSQLASMRESYVDEVMENAKGYYVWRAPLGIMVDNASSLNEMLHAVHSYIVNDEEILKSFPVIDKKENNIDRSITLIGEENELSRKLFDQFPIDMMVGETEIISMDKKILMMIRDRGHALTIDIDTSSPERLGVNYFIPKLCNRGMVEKLEGIGTITENGAQGCFETIGNDFPNKLFDFIEKVPTDDDIPKLSREEVRAMVMEQIRQEEAQKAQQEEKAYQANQGLGAQEYTTEKSVYDAMESEDTDYVFGKQDWKENTFQRVSSKVLNTLKAAKAWIVNFVKQGDKEERDDEEIEM